MPKGRFHGLIKDYDGGTMMECYVHPSIDYTRVSEMLTSQRKFILNRIRTVSKSDKKTYPPLSLRNSSSKRALPGRINESVARTMAIPGVSEAGWTVADLLASTNAAKDSDMQKNHLKSELLSIMCVYRSVLLVYFTIALNSHFISHVMSNCVSYVLSTPVVNFITNTFTIINRQKIEEQQFSWPFREPVDTTEVKDYLEIIKDPIDLLTVNKRIRKGDWYKSKKMLCADLIRMVANCKTYNDCSSPYFDCAVGLQKFLETIFPEQI